MAETQGQNGGGKACLTCGCITILVIIGVIVAIWFATKNFVKGFEPYLAKEPRKFVNEVLSAEETTQAVREWNTFDDNFKRKKRASITLNEKQINSIIASKQLQNNYSVKIGENDVVLSLVLEAPFTDTTKYIDCDMTATPQGGKEFDFELECFGDEPISEDIKKAFREGGKQGLVQSINLELFKIENGELTIEVGPRQ